MNTEKTIKKGYKFRIYPSPKQEHMLLKTFGCVRYAWNKWTENFNKLENKIFLTPKEFRETLPWMEEVSAAAVQQKERDFGRFKNQFFNKKRKKKVGRPLFKSRRTYQKFKLPFPKFKINQKNKRIWLEKIGWVRIVYDRLIHDDAKLMSVTVSRDPVGAYYASINVEQKIEIEVKPHIQKSVGVDVGLKSFAVLSDGTKTQNPRFFRENQTKLKRAQQNLSRKCKGSHRWERARLRVARIHRFISRQRDLFLHTLSHFLVMEYDVIAIEDLNVSGMLKNRHLSKSIADASWSELYRQLEYKAEWYGKYVYKVDRYTPTSRTCSVCSFYNKELTLSDREWTCLCCGTHHDRDENAAINILAAVGGQRLNRRGAEVRLMTGDLRERSAVKR